MIRLVLAFVVVFFIHLPHSLGTPLPETTLMVNKTWTSGGVTALWVHTQASTDYFTASGLYATCTAVLHGSGSSSSVGSNTWPLAEFDTGSTHSTPVAVDIPTVPNGRYELVVSCRSELGESTVSEQVHITAQTALYVITDRPRYRPGHTIRVRLSVVRPTDHRPAASQAVQLVLRDPRKTAVWQQSVTTNAAGFALAEIPLTDDLLTGTYRLDCTANSDKKSLEIEVRTEKNPPFRVDLLSAIEPSGTIRLDGGARYFYGEPVVGQATLSVHTAQGEKREIPVTLDPEGTFFAALEPGVKSAEVIITDEVGRTASRSIDITDPKADWELVVLPTGDPITASAPSYLTVCTLDSSGVPIPTRLTVIVNGQPPQTVESSGITRLPFTAPAPHRSHTQQWSARSYAVDVETAPDQDTIDTEKPLEALLSALADCVPHNDGMAKENQGDRTMVIHLTAAERRLGIVSINDVPFSDSPEFLVNVAPEVKHCVEQKFRRTSTVPGGLKSLRVQVQLHPEQIENTAPEQTFMIRTEALAKDGTRRDVSTSLTAVATSTVVSPMLESAVIEPGKNIVVRLPVPQSGITTVPTVVLVRQQTTLAVGSCTPDAHGFVECDLQPPSGVWGLATVHVLDTGTINDQKNTGLNSTAAATVFLRPQVLTITLDTPERVRPGTTLSFPVKATLMSGEPAVGVGVAASVIDEAALSLGPRFPSLLTSLTDAENDRFQTVGPTFSQLLAQSGDYPAARWAMDALLQRMPREAANSSAISTLGQRRESERHRLTQWRTEVYTTLTQYPERFAARGKTPVECHYTVAMDDVLARVGLSESQRRSPWNSPYQFDDVSRIDSRYACLHVARHVSQQRLNHLETWLNTLPKADRRALKKSPAKTWAKWQEQQRVPAGLHIDAWGEPVTVRVTDDGLQIRTPGDDGLLDTADDLVIDDVFQESVWRHGLGIAGYGMGAGGSARGSIRSASGIAHALMGQREPDAITTVRRRFDETVLWSVDTWTDQSGQAMLETTLADSITRWAVQIDAMAPDGAVGYAQKHVETFLPVFLDLSVPDHLTEGDVYFIPLQLANYSGMDAQWTVQTEYLGALTAVGPAESALWVKDRHTGAMAMGVRATSAGMGTVRVHLRDQAGKSVDAMERTIPVRAPGLVQRAVYPLSRQADMLTLQFTVPPNARRETIGGKIRLFRDALDGARDGLEGLLREPSGCFEQTSSTTYPNLLILQLLGNRSDKGDIRQKATDMVGRGYQKLLRFEVSGGGFSWFGDAPANRVLTAYGLVEFVDMQKVIPVDPELIERTRRWLLSHQNADGSFSPDKSWLHDWSAVQGKVSTTAYIAWALAEAGERGTALRKALQFLTSQQKELANNPYLLGLWARAATISSLDNTFPLSRLRSLTQSADGMSFVPSIGKTLMYGDNMAANVEVTALAAATRFRANDVDAAQENVEWLWKNRHPNYGWGTTQATVLALRAMAEIDQGQTDETSEPAVLTVDGQGIGDVVMTTDGIPTLDLVAVGPRLSLGSHTLSAKAKSPVRGELRLWWNSTDTDKAVQNGLDVVMDVTVDPSRLSDGLSDGQSDSTCPAGTEVSVRVGVRNPGNEVIAMPTVVFPIAPGYMADSASLKHVVGQKLAEKFEDHGDRVVFYLTSLQAQEGRILDFRVVSQAQSAVIQPAAQAYAYYSPDTMGASRPKRLVCESKQAGVISEVEEIPTTTKP